MADTDPTASDLLYTVQDGIGHVTFNRPQARNAMTFAMYMSDDFREGLDTFLTKRKPIWTGK